MPQNFIDSRREQGFLLPPDVRDWLLPDHLAWFVIDAVGQMDLSAFYGSYRADGHGRAAYEPSMMVTLVLYAFASDVRCSRAIERDCRQDVAYRVITGNVVPDHATIARFIVRHQDALADLFSEVLRLCDEAGLVRRGVVTIDGTRLAGNASRERNEADLAAERAGNEAFEHHRVHGRDAQGRRLAGTPTPHEPPEAPAGKVNVTDPDSKLIKASERYEQGFNAQTAVAESQIVLA